MERQKQRTKRKKARKMRIRDDVLLRKQSQKNKDDIMNIQKEKTGRVD